MRTQYGGFGITEIQLISIFSLIIPVFYRGVHDLRIIGYSIPEFIGGSLLIVYWYL